MPRICVYLLLAKLTEIDINYGKNPFFSLVVYIPFTLLPPVCLSFISILPLALSLAHCHHILAGAIDSICYLLSEREYSGPQVTVILAWSIINICSRSKLLFAMNEKNNNKTCNEKKREKKKTNFAIFQVLCIPEAHDNWSHQKLLIPGFDKYFPLPLLVVSFRNPTLYPSIHNEKRTNRERERGKNNNENTKQTL